MSGNGFNTGRPYHRLRQGPKGRHKDQNSRGLGATLHFDNYQFLSTASTGSTAPIVTTMEITSWLEGITGGLFQESGWNGGGKYQNQFTVTGGKRQDAPATYNGNTFYDVNEWDTTSGTTLPTASGYQGQAFATAVIGGTTWQYHIGGFNSARKNTIYRQAMSAPTSSWGSSVGTLPSVSFYGRAVWDGGNYIYITSGNITAYTDKKFWRYDLTSQGVSAMKDTPTGNSMCHLFSDGTYIYLAGGFNGSGIGGTYKFDPSTGASGTWTDLGVGMSAPVYGGAYDAYDGGMVVVGGRTLSAGVTSTVQYFNASAGTWTKWASVSPERGYAIGFTLDSADIGGTAGSGFKYTKDTFFTSHGLYGASIDNEITSTSWGVNT